MTGRDSDRDRAARLQDSSSACLRFAAHDDDAEARRAPHVYQGAYRRVHSYNFSVYWTAPVSCAAAATCAGHARLEKRGDRVALDEHSRFTFAGSRAHSLVREAFTAFLCQLLVRGRMIHM